MPSFAAEILRVAAKADHIGWYATPWGDHLMEIGGTHVPADRFGRAWLRYGDATRSSILPAFRVLSGAVPPSQFRGRIVLIGASAPGLTRVGVTPLRQTESSMLVQATLLESMLAGDVLRRPDIALAMEMAIALALSVTACLLITHLTIRAYLALFGGLAISLVISSFLAFVKAGLLLDWTMPIAALASTMLGVFAWRIWRKETLVRQRQATDLAAALVRAQAAD